MMVDPQEQAKRALAAAMIPTPDDLCGDLDPMAALYLLEQLGWAVLTTWAAHATDLDVPDDGAADDLGTTLSHIGEIVGMLDATCARIGLLPDDAVPPKP